MAVKSPSERTKRTKPAKRAAKPQHPDHDHEVEFRLSARTSKAIDAALKGLTSAQQDRVLEAVDRVGEEAGEKVGRWVEKNVVANANALLALLAPSFAAEGRWPELRSIRLFLDHLDVGIDHAEIEKEIASAHGTKTVAQYRREMKQQNSVVSRK